MQLRFPGVHRVRPVAGGERERSAPTGYGARSSAWLNRRSVLIAYYLGEMTVVNIAAMLDMPQGTVKTHLHRRRQTLRQH